MLAVGLPEDIPDDDEVQLRQEPSLEKTKTYGERLSANPYDRDIWIWISAKSLSSSSSETVESATEIGTQSWVAICVAVREFLQRCEKFCNARSSRSRSHLGDSGSIAFSTRNRNLINVLLEIATPVPGSCRHPDPDVVAGRREEIDK
ncbi:hypothetical protein TIFTF001_010033 [Ficus carica]|uniref:Uncharacterized protein n=1 Tax=Ficus carica TaxID=3494 RepID=A0AA88D332_FICCA|nr:hypothetical protein TIFTF001_010033 [Ficus carica]